MIVIIGAGVSGLTCAKYLKDNGVEALVLEASAEVGGRVKTDSVAGFKLDRGFQVLLTSYPEAQKLLDYKALNLKYLPSGACIRMGNKYHVMPNPLKNWATAPQALLAPVSSLLDKIKVLQLNINLRKAPEPLPAEPFDKITTLDYLKQVGYSPTIINSFFKPFFRGVFLEKELKTDAKFFKFLFSQFAKGDVVIPQDGMQAIPQQIAAHLNPQQIRLNTTVKQIVDNTIYLENGETIMADKIVLATDATTAAKLLGQQPITQFNATSCLYFYSTIPFKKFKKPYLIINTNNNELIAHLLVVSDVAPSYAPNGETLLSVSLVGKNNYSDGELIIKIQQELIHWFTDEYNWQHLRTYHIPEALPQYFEGEHKHQPLKINSFTYQCGDYMAYPSLNAAMKTGRQVAEMLME